MKAQRWLPPAVVMFAVAVGILGFLVAASGAKGAQVGQIIHAVQPKVLSTLDRTSVLPHRIRWQAKTNVPAADVQEIDFLIDGKLRWVEHNAPYWYGSDRDWLVTSFLTAGVHRFAVRLRMTNGRTATDEHTARVGEPGAVPADLVGTWQRKVSGAQAAANGAPAGIWHFRISRVGWHTLDPKGGVGLIDVAYLRAGLLESRSPIWTNPAGPSGSPTEGNGWCDAPFAPVRYRYTVSGAALTLQLVGPDRCGGEHIVWAGTWHRSP